jgi:hypothetical protein
MKTNFETHDGSVTLAFDRRKGIWAYSLFTKTARAIRTAGQISTEASAHTLQSLALTVALRSITRGQANRLAQFAKLKKPRLLVTCLDEDFLEALEAKMRNDKDVMAVNPLRTGKQFLTVLAQQLARFQLTFEPPEDGDMSNLVLHNWAANHLVDKKLIDNLPPALSPSLISQMF